MANALTFFVVRRRARRDLKLHARRHVAAIGRNAGSENIYHVPFPAYDVATPQAAGTFRSFDEQLPTMLG